MVWKPVPLGRVNSPWMVPPALDPPGPMGPGKPPGPPRACGPGWGAPGTVVAGAPVDGAAVDGVVVVDPELCAEATLTPTRAKVPAVTVAMATLRIVRPRLRGCDGPGAGGG